VHRLVDVVAQVAAVVSVRLVGSRDGGEPTSLSDWDFELKTSDFEQAATGIIRAAAGLSPRPLAVFFDPLGIRPSLTILLDGPIKVDLIFPGVPFTPAPPWEVTPETLVKLDWHFWDWTLWLAAKRAKGLDDVVHFGLEDLHGFVLRPLGIDGTPSSLEAAMDAYEAAREQWEEQLELEVDPELGRQVKAAVAAERAGPA